MKNCQAAILNYCIGFNIREGKYLRSFRVL